VKPAPFDYIRIDTLEEACTLLANHGDSARVLAGGQSLMPILNMRLAHPEVLLDISRCRPLDYVRMDARHLVVGAAATQATVEGRPDLHAEVPLLAQAFPWISHFQIRNRGTVCGSLAHADPSAELPLCLLALDGQIVLRSHGGERTVRAKDFFHGMLTTDRHAEEILVEARFPRRADHTSYAFAEFSMRHGDYAIVAAAAVITHSQIRLAIGGVADRPTAVEWPSLDSVSLDTALNDFAWSLEAQSDAQASAAVRRHLVRQLGRDVIVRAQAARAGTVTEPA